MPTPQEQFRNFESNADTQVANLDLWRMPLRSVASNFFLTVDSLFTGGRFHRQNERRVLDAEGLLSHISYLAHLFSRCDTQIGEHIDDALAVFDAEHIVQFQNALAYGHFSELMPEFWRRYYEVEVIPNGYRLRHPSAVFTETEECDIALTELSLAHDIQPRQLPRDALSRMIRDWPRLDGKDVHDTLGGGFNHYLDVISEQPLLRDAAFVMAFGFRRSEFHKVRASLMAIADFCLGMADAAELEAVRGHERERAHYERQCREWIVPLLTQNFILGTIGGLTHIAPSVIDKIIDFLVMNANSKDFQNSGDGYLPLLIRLQDSFLFSPYSLKIMLAERNLLYVFNKRDSSAFSSLVSHDLEPMLLDQAEFILRRVPGIFIARNVVWSSGEVDLLAFEPSVNVVLQIQAKAALPPQGARMTQQVESHTQEAIRQLSLLESQSADERDRIFKSAFQRTIKGATLISALLSRASLGTWRAWSSIGHFVPLNLVVLRGAIHRTVSDPNRTLADFPLVVKDLITEIRARAITRWETGRISLFGSVIELPILRLNREEIEKIRAELGP